ncbi:hypothetical protein BDZ89DRAFT_1049003 [Hymenopellis radicata]|nr:hypothetical protein BDZ89DRAFT_1049003 [Hymenopellis radicata]
MAKRNERKRVVVASEAMAAHAGNPSDVMNESIEMGELYLLGTYTFYNIDDDGIGRLTLGGFAREWCRHEEEHQAAPECIRGRRWHQNRGTAPTSISTLTRCSSERQISGSAYLITGDYKSRESQRNHGPQPASQTGVIFHAPYLTKLPRMTELATANHDPFCVPAPYCEIAQHFPNNELKALRVLNNSANANGIRLQNIFSAHPGDFCFVNYITDIRQRRVIRRDADNEPARFLMVVRVTSSNLSHAIAHTPPHLCFEPIHRFFPRILSVMACALNFKRPILSLGLHGIRADAPKEHPRSYRSNSLPPYSILLDINIYDGRLPFSMSHYRQLPIVTTDFEIGDFAILVFTITGTVSTTLNAVQLGAERVDINILFAILLARPDTSDGAANQNDIPHWMLDETPLAVDRTHFIPK